MGGETATERTPQADITGLLLRSHEGDQQAHESLIRLVYPELKRIAGRRMRREAKGHLLQPTALVNEAYVRLAGQSNAQWQSRAHFYAVAARLMWRILVDHARSRDAAKHGGKAIHVDLDDVALSSRDDRPTILAVHEALERLRQIDAEAARVVELRYIAGLTQEETSASLQTSISTVKRKWDFARAYLHRQLRSMSDAAG